MPKLTNKELGSIKEIVSQHQVISSKLSYFANQCNDNEVKSMFKSAASEAEKSVQQLIQLLD